MKLKEYSYEFEIDENLQLASVDGVKTENGNYVSKAEFEEMKKQVETLSTAVSILQNKDTNKIQLIKRDMSPASQICPNGVTNLEKISFKGYGSGKAIISVSCYCPYNNTAIILSLKSNGKEMARDADINETSGLRSAHSASVTATIDYNEETDIVINYFTDKEGTPKYGYSILLIPNE